MSKIRAKFTASLRDEGRRSRGEKYLGLARTVSQRLTAQRAAEPQEGRGNSFTRSTGRGVFADWPLSGQTDRELFSHSLSRRWDSTSLDQCLCSSVPRLRRAPTQASRRT